MCTEVEKGEMVMNHCMTLSTYNKLLEVEDIQCLGIFVGYIQEIKTLQRNIEIYSISHMYVFECNMHKGRTILFILYRF